MESAPVPVYECYCPDCHTIFSFFSRRVDTATHPDCPRCGRPGLSRQASLFAISKGRGDQDPAADGTGQPGEIDEAAMMRALSSMSGELEQLDDADPRQAARLMRRVFEAGGLDPGPGMAEAIRRMEAGEDPDAVDAELGDQLEQEPPFAAGGSRGGGAAALRRLRREFLPAAQDDHWYPLKVSSGPHD
jgi:putative FmdB family regulatory protein